MAMFDFGTVRYFNLVADKQKNVYVNACSGLGSRGGVLEDSLTSRTHFQALGLGLESQVLGLDLEVYKS